MNEPMINQLTDLMGKKEWVKFAFLFGSYARQKSISESDVDVAIWPETGTAPEKINTLWGEIENLTKKNVDLVELPKARPTIAWAALRGVPLVIKDRRLYLKTLLSVSDEAEDMQDFTLDLFQRRQKKRGAAP